jgi:hypothetical protein
VGVIVCWVCCLVVWLVDWSVGRGLVFVVNTLWKLYSCCFVSLLISTFPKSEGDGGSGPRQDCGWGLL